MTLNRHRVYIFPTTYGFLFMGVLFAMLAGSINYNNNLGFLLVFLLGAITLVSMIHTYRNLIGLTVLSTSVNPVFAGDIAVVRFTVRSETTRRTAIAAAFKGHDTALENIAARIDTFIDVKAPSRDRGIYRPGRLTLWTRYPLSLFRAWSVIDLDLNCIVYPKPIPGPFIRAMGMGNVEQNGTSHDHGADDFSGLKVYQAGDPIRRIAWKSLSRGLGVFSKNFEGDGRAALWLDYETITGTDPEKKLSRICDMVLKAHTMNVEYGLTLPGKTIPPDKGDRHKHKCLKALALFGISEANIQ